MVRVRVAPSPTGLLHIGTVRTALFNYLFAKHHGGTMILRIEDTDKARSTAEFEKDIVEGLVRLGIAGDEGVHTGGEYGPYRQSERTALYTQHVQQLLDEDKAYYCFCTPEELEKMRAEQIAQKLPPRYDGRYRDTPKAEVLKRIAAGEKAVVRLKVPQEGEITFNDLIRGPVMVALKEYDDFVIARRLDDPLYNLTVVIDDITMKISHVIRGEDHLSNTPKQILIYRALGQEPPQFAHLPLILNADRTKLSKRKNKVSFGDFMAEGYLPEAMLNFLALLGWSHPEGKEILSLQELAAAFDLDRVHKAGAIFDRTKLDWFNGQYLRKAIMERPEAVWEELAPILKKTDLKATKEVIFAILRDPDLEGRFHKLSEVPEVLRVFFGNVPAYEKSLLLNVKSGVTPEIVDKVMGAAIKALGGIGWERKAIEGPLMALPAALGLKNGQVLWPIRAALSGAEKSPNFATLALHLGKEETLKRLNFAVAKVRE